MQFTDWWENGINNKNYYYHDDCKHVSFKNWHDYEYSELQNFEKGMILAMCICNSQKVFHNRLAIKHKNKHVYENITIIIVLASMLWIMLYYL